MYAMTGFVAYRELPLFQLVMCMMCLLMHLQTFPDIMNVAITTQANIVILLLHTGAMNERMRQAHWSL